MLDLFCGRWGWSRTFAARGWECVGVDLTEPPEIPPGCIFLKRNVLSIDEYFIAGGYYGPRFDFIVASSPCEQFSLHGMKCFHPDPPFPHEGTALFRHTERICKSSGIPYVMENVRAAQQFVGQAVNHCGPFYLWGNAVPPLLHRGIKKGANLRGKLYHDLKRGKITREQFEAKRREVFNEWGSHGSEKRKHKTASIATIPPELANCVAEYAERLWEQRRYELQCMEDPSAHAQEGKSYR